MTSERRSKTCILPMLMLKTILDEVLAIQNNHGQRKCYQPQPLALADNTSETLISRLDYVFSFAKSVQLILGNSATYRLFNNLL